MKTYSDKAVEIGKQAWPSRTRRGYGGDKRAHNGDKQDRQIANHLRCFLLLEVLNFWLEFALSMVLTHRY